MQESIGTILVIMVLAGLWIGRKPLKEFSVGLEEDVKASVAESSVETARKVQEANAELDKLIAEHSGKLVSASDVIKKARGES